MSKGRVTFSKEDKHILIPLFEDYLQLPKEGRKAREDEARLAYLELARLHVDAKAGRNFISRWIFNYICTYRGVLSAEEDIETLSNPDVDMVEWLENLVNKEKTKSNRSMDWNWNLINDVDRWIEYINFNEKYYHKHHGFVKQALATMHFDYELEFELKALDNIMCVVNYFKKKKE